MSDKRFMSHRRHVIWYSNHGYMVALKRDGTDDHFETWQEAMEAIDEYEDNKLSRQGQTAGKKEKTMSKLMETSEFNELLRAGNAQDCQRFAFYVKDRKANSVYAFKYGVIDKPVFGGYGRNAHLTITTDDGIRTLPLTKIERHIVRGLLA